jgi:hypothetical protein
MPPPETTSLLLTNLPNLEIENDDSFLENNDVLSEELTEDDDVNLIRSQLVLLYLYKYIFIINKNLVYF